MAKAKSLYEKPEHEFASKEGGYAEDWVEYTFTDSKGVTRRYRINVSWLLSRHHCLFGEGRCPSIMATGVTPHGGCCQVGIGFTTADEWERIQGVVDKLQVGKDIDAITNAQLRDWWTLEHDDDGNVNGYHTRVVNGNCVFSNTGRTPGVPLGCALHVFALRKGTSPTKTKPHGCYTLPNAIFFDTDENDGMEVVTVTSHMASWWNQQPYNTAGNPGAIGWLCTETADAFDGDKPVYVEYEDTLRAELGDEAYKEMERQLDLVPARTWVRPAMGEQYNNGRQMIPLMVEQRIKVWDHAIDVRGPKDPVQREAIKALETSRPYVARFAQHLGTPDDQTSGSVDDSGPEGAS